MLLHERADRLSDGHANAYGALAQAPMGRSGKPIGSSQF
jgi:hypothetical protein